MANVHQIVVKWSKVKIDADKNMNGSDLFNLDKIEVKGIDECYYHYRVLNIYPNEIQHVVNGELAFRYGYAGSITPSKDKTYNLGLKNTRFKDSWVGGNLGIGVIKEPGSTLTVDIILDDAYTEIASYLDETNTTTTTGWADDWDIGALDTYTDVKLQFDYNNYSSSDNWQYRLLEDGVEVLSFTLPANSTGTLSGEYTTLKQSCEYKTQINSTKWHDGNWKIKNRYLYFKKRYLGIKAGS